MIDLAFKDEYRDFRQDIRTFIEENLTAEMRAKTERGEFLGRELHVEWQKKLQRHGWGAPNWPTEHGGTGWSLAEQFVLEQELAANYAPPAIYFGLDMVGPLLMDFGTEAQKAFFLPEIISGDLWWCQGFSEPNAGSDLASLQCRAVLEGDHYVVNGSKIWTSGADIADWMFGLFRTDSSGKKQLGITLLLIEMSTPGITIAPIRTFEGGAEVNQTFFDNVKVPVSGRVAEEGKGWTLAKYLLGYERLGIAQVARSKAMLERLKRIAGTEQESGLALAEDEIFANHMAEVEVGLAALEATEHRFLFDPDRGGELGAEASILKIRGTELQQRVLELAVEALGYYGLPDVQPLPEGSNEEPIGPDYAAFSSELYFNYRKISIYGGSNEIQRNIVAKAVLGF